MNKKIVYKIVISLIICFVVLTFISSFYYSMPVHHDNKDKATDYVWDKNSIYIKTNEGIGFGKTNNEGFMNSYDYDGNIDILLMGSSHMEGTNIPYDKTVSYLLNEKINNKEIYNIGMAGHSLKVIINNLNDALNKYKPEYVILEISNLVLSDKYINNILNNNVDEIESNSDGVIGFLQRNPFLRLAYTQIEELIQGENFILDEANEESSESRFNKDLIIKLVEYIKNISNKYNTKVIVMYHPSVSISKNGEMIINNKEIAKSFGGICKEKEIYFLDMTERFLKEYENDYTIPNGFVNTSIGAGHLNVDGHRMIADELAKIIQEIE